MKTWKAPAMWVVRGWALVDADTAKEAASKFETLKDSELDSAGAETVDWKTTGDWKEDK